MSKATTALALDCARAYCSVALLYNETIIVKEERAPRAAAGALLDMMDTLLKDNHCLPEQLDFIAVTHGPGSFTGLRIACSMVQAMAFVHGIPVVPLSTLEVMAHAYYVEHQHPYVITLLDAYREEIYWSSYYLNEAGILTTQQPPQLVKTKDMTVPFEAPWRAIGDACLLPKTLALYDTGYYNASHLLPLGAKAFHEGKTVRAETLTPLYVRDESAWSSG